MSGRPRGNGRRDRATGLPPAVDDWLFRKAADENVSIAAVMRRAMEREMIRDPVTSDPAVNEAVAEYLGVKYELEDAIMALFKDRRRRAIEARDGRRPELEEGRQLR
jgi:hypothetical protein